MLQLIRPKGALQLRSCVGFLKPVGHQSQVGRLSSLPNSAVEPKRPFDGLPIGRLIDELSQPNELANRLEESMQVLLSKGKRKTTTPEEDEDKKELNKILEKLDIKRPDRPVDPTLKSSLNPDYDPHDNRPNRQQLEEFYQYIEKAFPRFFLDKVDLTYFEQHVVIEDNQSAKQKKEMGYNKLISKISMIRIYYSLMYSQNLMNMLGIAKVPEEGLVKVRWRIVSKGRALIFLQFWKIREMQSKEYWNDGIVSFYLNKRGKVRKICLDKVDKSKEEAPRVMENMAKV